jgi:hypothetical protein
MATAALGCCCAALPAPAVAAPVLPRGLVWVQQGSGDGASTLHRVAADGSVTRTPLGYSVNAIGRRFIPVAGSFMIAAVAMTRLVRRRR